jgi:hypothetical protein
MVSRNVQSTFLDTIRRNVVEHQAGVWGVPQRDQLKGCKGLPARVWDVPKGGCRVSLPMSRVPHTRGLKGCRVSLPGFGVSPNTPFIPLCRRRRQGKGSAESLSLLKSAPMGVGCPERSQLKGVQGHPAGVWGVPKYPFYSLLPPGAARKRECRGFPSAKLV